MFFRTQNCLHCVTISPIMGMSTHIQKEVPMTEIPKTKSVVLYSGDVESDSINPMARYQSSRVVRIVTDRIHALDTQGLTQMQCATVAQCALSNRLNPFPPRPDLHYWLSEVYDSFLKKKVVKLNIMEQREATIRNAEMNAKREGTYLHAPRFYHIIDDTQKEQFGFAPTDKVCRATVSDHRQVTEYFDRRRELKEEGMTSEKIDERLGIEPECYEGYGSLNSRDQEKARKGRFNAINKLQKRAYVEALKQKWARLIDYDELIAGAPDDDDAYVIDGEWRTADIGDELPEDWNGNDTPTPPDPDEPPEPDSPELPPRPWLPQDLRKALMFVSIKNNLPEISDKKKLALFLTLKTLAGGEESRWRTFLAFCFATDSWSKRTNGQLVAIERWLSAEKDKETGAWIPCEHVVQEFNDAIEARMVEMGQETLPWDKETSDGDTSREDPASDPESESLFPE